MSDPSTPERRRAPRTSREEPASVVLYPLAGKERAMTGLLKDFSTIGVGMVFREPVAMRDLILYSLRGLDNVSVRSLYRVVRCQQIGSGWSIGAELVQAEPTAGLIQRCLAEE